MSTNTAQTIARPAPIAPSWGWALRRAALGLTIMLAVTSVAAFIAYASIEPSTADEAGPTISIGTPAAAILKR